MVIILYPAFSRRGSRRRPAVGRVQVPAQKDFAADAEEVPGGAREAGLEGQIQFPNVSAHAAAAVAKSVKRPEFRFLKEVQLN